MIPATWTPHHRESDGELVGYLVPADHGYVPVTLFGHPLAVASELDDATAVLEAEGMACLADYWWLHRATEHGPEVIKVKIYEVTPDRLSVVIDDFGVGADLNTRIDLEVPEPGRLTRHASRPASLSPIDVETGVSASSSR